MRNQKLCKILLSLISLRELRKFICDGRKSLEKKLESFKLVSTAFSEKMEKFFDEPCTLNDILLFVSTQEKENMKLQTRKPSF